MDPTITLTQLRHPDTHPAERLDLAIELARWLRRGGFVPAGETLNHLLDELDRIIAPPVPAQDAHLESAYDDRTDIEVDW